MGPDMRAKVAAMRALSTKVMLPRAAALSATNASDTFASVSTMGLPAQTVKFAHVGELIAD
jgi:hypothetical protein